MSIEGIAAQRVAHIEHMDPYLMGASGFQFEGEKGVPWKPFKHLVMGDGRLTVWMDRSLSFGRIQAGDGLVDGAAILRNQSLCQGNVTFADAALFILNKDALMGELGFANQDQSGGVFIKAVDRPKQRMDSSLLPIESHRIGQGAGAA